MWNKFKQLYNKFEFKYIYRIIKMTLFEASFLFYKNQKFRY